MSRPWLATIATTATMPSETAIGTLISTSASTAANRTACIAMARLRFNAGRRTSAAPADAAAPACADAQLDQVHASRRRGSAPHEIGITDCTTLIGTHGRLTSESPARTGRIDTPTQPSSAKKAITSTCATMPSARRTRRAMLVDEFRAADVRALAPRPAPSRRK